MTPFSPLMPTAVTDNRWRHRPAITTVPLQYLATDDCHHQPKHSKHWTVLVVANLVGYQIIPINCQFQVVSRFLLEVLLNLYLDSKKGN